MKNPPSPAARRIGKALIDLRRNAQNRAIQRKLYSVGDHELTPVQVDILEVVVAAPGQQMNELAQALGVNASTVSRTVLPLLNLELIERRPGEQDRRMMRLFPTPAGLRQARTIVASREVMMREVQSHFTPERMEMFADLLEEYIVAVSAAGLWLLKADETDG